jgi:hypothetical protein
MGSANVNHATAEELALVANFTAMTFVMLIENLEKTGALQSGAMERALRATMQYPGAEVARLDYRLFASLLAALEKRDAATGQRSDVIDRGTLQ